MTGRVPTDGGRERWKETTGDIKTRPFRLRRCPYLENGGDSF